MMQALAPRIMQFRLISRLRVATGVCECVVFHMKPLFDACIRNSVRANERRRLVGAGPIIGKW